MTPAVAPAPSPSAIPRGPVVVIDYRAPCVVARQEIFGEPEVDGGVHGPDPLRVVKALCRSLGITPGAVSAEPDDQARGRRDEAAACYVLDGLNRRVAHVRGLSFAWINVAASALVNAGWNAGRAADVSGPGAAP